MTRPFDRWASRLPNADQRRTAARLAVPGIVADLAEMRGFARDRGLVLRGAGGYRRFREARRFGIHLLPPVPLTGRVLDVGANEGQFAAALLGVAPGVRVTAFEPEPRTAERLRARFAADPRVAVHQCALGGSAGTRELHVTSNTVFASLHRPLDELAELYPRGSESVAVLPVETATLDEMAPAGPVAVLKIDVQGAELDVLGGGRDVLSRTRAVLLEVNFVPHYEGEASFGRLHEHMLGAGFRLRAMHEAKAAESTGHLLWTDACYVRV